VSWPSLASLNPQACEAHGGAHAIRVPLVMMVNQLCVV